MLQALSTALSGIRFGTTQLDVAAENVATAGVAGRGRREVVGVERPEGGVQAAVVPGVDDGPAADLVAAIIARHTVSLNAAVLRRADQVQGELVDLLG